MDRNFCCDRPNIVANYRCKPTRPRNALGIPDDCCLFPPAPPCKKIVKKTRKCPEASLPEPPEEPRWVGRAYYILHTDKGFKPRQFTFAPEPRDDQFFLSYQPIVGCEVDVGLPPVCPDRLPPVQAKKEYIYQRVCKKKYVNYCSCRMPPDMCICGLMGPTCTRLPKRVRGNCEKIKRLMNEGVLCKPIPTDKRPGGSESCPPKPACKPKCPPKPACPPPKPACPPKPCPPPKPACPPPKPACPPKPCPAPPKPDCPSPKPACDSKPSGCDRR